MKKIYSFLFAIVALVLNAQGIFESQAVINNGSGDVWYNLQSTNTENQALNGHYFGTYNNSQILSLAGYMKTWEPTSGPAIQITNFYYRVYLEGTTPPSSFNTLSITSYTDLGYDGSSHNKAWGVSSSANLLTGLANGSYVFDIYMMANTATDNSGSSYYDSNSSNNYKGYFTIDNSTLAVSNINSAKNKSTVIEGKLYSPKKGNLNLTVYDFSGKLVKTMSVKADGNAIDLNTQKGLYLVKISDGTSTEVVKFAK